MKLPVLETRRLILLPAQPRLAKKTAAFYEKNKGFLQPFEPTYDPDFTTVSYQKALLKGDARAARDNTGLRYWLFRKEDPETPIGCVAFTSIVWGAFRSATLAYKIDRDLLRKGYAAEALEAMVELAFEGLGLHRLEASIMPRNAASLALAKRCGFSEEGRSPRYIRINGVWEDHIHMVRLNEEGE